MNTNTTRGNSHCAWPSRRDAGESGQPIVTVTGNDPTARLYRAAEKRAQAKLGFYIHATVFVLVSAMQFGINLFTAPWVFWSVFPFMGWGLWVAIHGLVVWFKTSDLRDQLIEEELEGLRSPQIVETPMASPVAAPEESQRYGR